MLYKQDCLNCGKTFPVYAHEVENGKHIYFCCEQCRYVYYENSLLKFAKDKEMDEPIHNRWEILDL